MRAISTPSPVRHGKRHLLESCAIVAGMAALAYGGPALAQGVAGTGQVVAGPGLSGATISPPAPLGPTAPPNTTQVTTTGPQTIINWTPTDTSTDTALGAIDFLPADNNLEFYGTGQYTVLNRFIGPASAARQIGINGTVNGYIGSPFASGGNTQGGNIWFYNAGGILVGGSATFNVGSLLLTANNIDTADGLFGPGGEIRFRGVAGTSEVQIAQGATVNALTVGNPGGSYVALVAPRIVQRGRVRTDGSTAYVAAEQADISINNGLFDINVTVGAADGDVITHSGVTTGPAHQQGDTDQNRIYMVAIPKNDAVTMLVSGQIGYEDALSAQVDPDGAVRLSAGYNIVDGEFAAAPVATGTANITVNDTLFLSDVVAHASGAFTGRPLSEIPPPIFDTPDFAHVGRISVQGNATFIGDESTTITVDTNRFVGATGDLIIQTGAAGGVPGAVNVNVDGGQISASNLSILADGAVDAATGDSRGGTAALTVSNGGSASAVGTVTVSANGIAGRDTAGAGGDGTGGTATITVTGSNLATGVASRVAGNTIVAAANGVGGGLEDGGSGIFTASDQGGSGTGGNVTISVQDGASLTATDGSVTASASGSGQIGNIQSGNGTGGAARIEVAGADSVFDTPTTTIDAFGAGGGSISDIVIGTIPSQGGGSGRGGSATLSIAGDATTAINPGATSLNVTGSGGGAVGAENVAGGNAVGGTATVEASGLVAVTFPSLTVTADGFSGGASSPSLLTGQSGNATGGTINVTADNGATLTVDANVQLFAAGIVAFSENLGSGLGGNVTVSAEDAGTIDVAGGIGIDVSGGGFGTSISESGGSGTGGRVNLLAARSGVLTASRYDVVASGLTANVRGTGGPAQGGFVNIEATAGGSIAATDVSLGTIIDASALSGVSADGSVAGGGTIQITAGGGSIDFNATTTLQASGVSGGATNAGSSTTGNGGFIQIQVLDDPTGPSSIAFDTLQGGADGLTAVDVESAPGFEQSAGDGQGGTMAISVAGGTFTANSINVTADGYGGGVGTASGTGRGGTASYTQTGGTVTVGDMAISASGFGGFAPDVSGQGLGGNATIDLLGGTLTGGDIVAMAVGIGGAGAMGNDFDPAGAIPSGSGGEGQGGTATITVDGATVDASTLAAYATGSGGTGGVFVASSFGDPPGNGGDGGTGLGGTATVTVATGTVTAAGILADAAGIGGEGGTVFASSSSGVPVGTGVGGNGGEGRGGNATIDFTDAATVTGDITSSAAGIGGSGGGGFSGGNGGLAIGGLAQAIVTGFDAGTLAVTVDASAVGGNGADGSNGTGGRGGDARGGTARIEATGAGASATVGQANFVTDGVGGNGGNGGIPFGATPDVAPRGGDGGTGEGGALEVVASGGATVLLGPDTSGTVALGSRGTGGNAGNGSAAAFLDGSQGGDGGNGGGAIGGTVHLLASGGTITSNGVPVDIAVDGTAGVSGSGGAGTGTGADGASGSSNGTTGGRVSFEAFSNPGEAGQISLGATTIAANGDSAGRIEMRAEGTIAMTSLSAEALGLAPPTNLDTDTASTGIFMSVYGDTGAITTTGAMSLNTGSSIGVYAQAAGTVAAGGDLTMQAADEIDIRHDFRTGTAPTIAAGGAMSINAAVSIRAQTGSLLSAGTSLLLNAFASNGGINVDGIEAGTSTLILSQNVARVGSSTSGDDLTINSFLIDVGSANAGDDISIIGNNLTLGTLTTDGSGLDSEIDGSNIFLQSAAATTVTHAEADNDFTAVVGSFQTGLNSIITGGDIIVNSPGAVDLGNSTAGGFVSVNGQSIAFNAIDAGSTVFLTATGTVPGAAGIGGVSIDAGDNISLNATEIGITGTVASGGSIVANGSAGAVAIDTANADDTIFIEATGDITGAYNGFRGVSLNAGGDIAGSASATGFESSSSGTPIAASVFVDAGGDVTLTSGNAAGMYGVNAGGSATLTGVSAGEDLLVRAGTTASLTNLTAGDDLTVQAPGTITAAGLLTTGTGPDNQSIDYSTGFDVITSSPDGSNIVLTSTGGNVAANSANAFDNLTVTAAGTLSSTGLLQSGLVTSLTGNLVNLTAVTAGTDIGVNSASAASATGALAAGHDVTVVAAANVNIAELDAGDDVSVNAGGTARIGAAYSYGSGLDNEGNGSNIGITAGGALILAGIVQSAGNVTLQGPSVSTAAIDAAGDVAVTATAGSIVANGDISGFRITLDAAGNISHAANSRIDADFTLRLDADGNIRVGTASSGDDMFLTAGGTITGGALTSDRNILLFADQAVNLTGDASAGLALRIEGSAVDLGDIAVDAAELGITATSGGVQSTGAINANGPVTVVGAGAVSMTGDMITRSVINISGASVTVGNVTGSDSISLIASDGAVNSTGTLDAGRNIFISTTDGGSFNRMVAGDDIAINGSGDIDIAFMNATGDNPDGEEIGSNVGINLTAGNVFVAHGEAADDYVVNATSFRTGLNSIIAGGNIDITTVGASDLGNSTAGGSITVAAQSIAFNTLDAGATINLTANGTAAGAEGIDGATVIAGSDINMNGNSIAITDSVTGAANFFAIGSGGAVAVARADVTGTISIFANGNLTGTYVAGNNIFLDSAANITASANANGGNLFVDAAGNATLTDSGAASMFGVNAGQAASITGGTAGEDLLVIAGTTANLSNVTVGDDVTVRANGAITAQGVRTTGAGTDNRALSFSPASGFTISSGEGTSATDGADIVMASASGAINAGGLSAGDDILLTAATALTLNGATTLGLGITGGDSSIRTQSASAVLGGLAAASDVVVDASGAIAVNSPSTAGRDVIINAASANIAILTNPAGDPVDTLAAGRDLSIQTAGAIAGGSVSAGRDLTLSAGSTIDIARASTAAGGSLTLDAAAGITAASLGGGGATSLTSADGAIVVGNLASAGPVSAIGDSVAIDGAGNLIFSQLQAAGGNARVTTGGNLAITAGTVSGEARLSAGGNLAVTRLDAGDAILASNGTMTLGNVTADETLAATAQSLLTVNGAVTGRTMSLASADIAIASAGRVGTGTTESLELRNIDNRVQTFIGGTGTQNGYHIDSDELTRVYGTDIRIFAPAVDRSGGRFIGTLPPDVVIDDFTMTAGSSTSNLGTNGSLTIATPGTARVVGDVALTGMGDNNALNIFADQSLEIILGEASIRLSGSSSSAPAGRLNLASEDVIVATLAAIDDVAAAGSTDAIEDRLAQNDGITSDEGALFAGGINVGVSGGFYVQNSGGSDFGERRGLTFGALGLNVDTAGTDTRIVINGVHLGPSGQVTGLDTIPLLTINGIASGQAPTDAFDQRSRFNGCLIANTGACLTIPEPEYHNSFPVQDVIEEEVDDDGDDGITLPQSLITMRDLDPLTGEPLLDDPVTGAGNDDLWTPATDTQQP
ncbi:hypothetical protein [Sphingopyxis macrogoltabida]|uniref:Filamentous haemagglutinin FhaB/tRNA nuclease CdiA-like TPS domain-containing protein n=1 Tax=Sphingopyxis macrogoltabida TaxID=33050 RepID=A0AAC8Z304_SPHMC|nr:hypothetical protein [Sphingopyxis macrogoltabida]ALJ14645.1 hypothetical protein LH19_17375 [Sphingopyxis macrogoltabida]AMU90906.1 hypothetical protein ATM17_17945 [Sphingopyxis macrogoltabida]